MPYQRALAADAPQLKIVIEEPSLLGRLMFFALVGVTFSLSFYLIYKGIQHEWPRPLWRSPAVAVLVVLWIAAETVCLTSGTEIGSVIVCFGFAFTLCQIPNILRKRPERKGQSAKEKKARNMPNSGAVVMTAQGLVMIVSGALSAVCHDGQSTLNIWRYHEAEGMWRSRPLNETLSSDILVAGLVALGVGAVLLIGGIVWLILAKNRRDH